MSHACNCIGPQNGEPRCPCMMRGIIQRDGRWVEPERDLGPVSSAEITEALRAIGKIPFAVCK